MLTLVVKSPGYYGKGPWFSSQRPHDNSELLATSVPEKSVPCSSLLGHQVHTLCTYVHPGTLAHTIQ